jgi:phosphomethylpyrimidine synthase
LTQLEQAKKGNITPEMEKVAESEGIEVGKLLRRVSKGQIVIPKNNHGKSKPLGIGKGLKTKVNANVGSSSEMEDTEWEVKKAEIAVEYGADTLMDLSTGPQFKDIRTAIMEKINIPIGTVPIYEAAIKASKYKEAVINMDEDDMFQAIINQANEGVDFITVHCGITRETVEKLKNSSRIMGIVSRGGAFTAAWILKNQEENPLYKNYDYLLEIAHEHDVTISLGDGLRPGCTHDASDIPQISELVTLGSLVKRAREKGVQVMVEGPGHVPLNQIESNIQLQKTVCNGAPFYVLGPLVTDLAPGYDHITSAIGGAIAAAAGADYLCYVTPAEHLSIPDEEDVKEGVIASRIAAQAADLAKDVGNARENEIRMAQARKEFNWELQFKLALDGEKARKCRYKRASHKEDMCTMCGDFCAIKLVRDDF